MQKTYRNYLTPTKPDPECKVVIKQHIPKLMFLGAVVWRHYDLLRRRQFDRKLGLWVIGEQVEVKRDSVNRARGTLEWKPVVMTKELYKQYLLEKFVLAIVKKWPHKIYCNGLYKIQKVYIQHEMHQCTSVVPNLKS